MAAAVASSERTSSGTPRSCRPPKTASRGDPRDRAEKAAADWGLERLPVGYGLTREQMADWGLCASAAIKDEENDLFSEPAAFLVDADQNLWMAVVSSAPFSRPALDDFSEHIGKGVTDEKRARWVQLLLTSAREAGLPNDAEFRAAFQSYIAWGSRLASSSAYATARCRATAPGRRSGSTRSTAG